MCGLERSRNLARVADCCLYRHTEGNRRAWDQLHHQTAQVCRLFKSVNLGDVGMIQGRQGLCFTLESCEPLGVARQFRGQYFDGDFAIKPGIARPKNLAHADGADGCEDLEYAQTSSACERHTGCRTILYQFRERARDYPLDGLPMLRLADLLSHVDFGPSSFVGVVPSGGWF
jgi:hypothetical protein